MDTPENLNKNSIKSGKNRKNIVIAVATAFIIVVALGIFLAIVKEALRPRTGQEMAPEFFENEVSDFKDLEGGGIRMDDGSYKAGDFSFHCDLPVRLKNAADYKEVIAEEDKRLFVNALNDTSWAPHFQNIKDVRILVRKSAVAMLIWNTRTKFYLYAPPGIGASLKTLGIRIEERKMDQ